MKNKIDKILLGILWLVALSLGACFWFNTWFGFNVFSAAHWHHLAYVQASQQPVQTSFYVSLILFAIMAIFGLYFFVRPRTRTSVTQTPPPTPTHVSIPTPAPAAPVTQAAPIASPAPVAAATPTQTEPTPTTIPTITPPAGVMATRPPRLNLPMRPQIDTHDTPPITPIAPQPTYPSSTPSGITDAASPAPQFPELAQIFTASGFVTKPIPQFSGIPISLMAIGTNETVWMGGMGLRISDMRTAADRLAHIFTDTLDDVYININCFVIAAPDAATSDDAAILKFDSVGELRGYMSNITNPPVTPEDQENFDAFSEYIDTVINYIGKS